MQISPGHFRGRTTEVDFGEVRIFREQLNTRVEQIFAPPDGTMTFSVLSNPGAPCRFAGADVGAQDFCLIPGGREFHAITARESDVLCIEIDESLLADDDLPILPHGRLQPIWHTAQTRQVAWWVSSMLECCAGATSPGVSSDEAGVLAGVALDSCRALLKEGGAPKRLQQRQRGARFDLVMRARDLACEVLPEPLDVETMAEQLKVSPRLLEDSFHDIVGMGAATWLRLRRLNHAHRSLRRHSPGTATVAEIATRWGFWHLGRFSSYYRDLFGCAPSHTLRRGGDAHA